MPPSHPTDPAAHFAHSCRAPAPYRFAHDASQRGHVQHQPAFRSVTIDAGCKIAERTS